MLFVCILNVKCSCKFKWVYPVFPSVYSVLVYHRYTNANIGSEWVITQLNIFPTLEHTNSANNGWYHLVHFFLLFSSDFHFTCWTSFFSNLYRFIGPVGRVFANGLGDLGSIPVHVIPKTQKMVLDTALLNTRQHIKG